MSRQKAFVMDAQDLYNLLVHYTDGELPLRGEVRQVLVNERLEQMIGFLVESDEWQTAVPLQIRYEGNRIATWSPGKEQVDYEQRNDTPQWQG